MWVQLDSIHDLRTAFEIRNCDARPDIPQSAELSSMSGHSIGHMAGEGSKLRRQYDSADPQRPDDIR